MRATMVWGEHRGVVLAVHGEADPTDAEWGAFLRACEASTGTALLVLSNGGGPSAAQREQIDRIPHWRDRPTAIVTESAIALGIVTTILGSGGNTRVFYLRQMDEAFDYVQIDKASRDDFARRLTAMKEDLANPADWPTR
jgi:hypothetical protein